MLSMSGHPLRERPLMVEARPKRVRPISHGGRPWAREMRDFWFLVRDQEPNFTVPLAPFPRPGCPRNGRMARRSDELFGGTVRNAPAPLSGVR
jgi:hypothetical protein